MTTVPQFINASAGTGKTTRLVIYYLYKLLQSSDPKKIIACTFTIAATNEFKNRVIEYLRAPDEDLENLFESFGLEPISIPTNKNSFIPLLEIKTLDSFFLSLFSKNSNSIFYRVMTDFDFERVYEKSYKDWIISAEGFEEASWHGRLKQVVKKLEPYGLDEIKNLFNSSKFLNLDIFLKSRKEAVSKLFLEIKDLLPDEFKPTPKSKDYIKLINDAYLNLDFSDINSRKLFSELSKLERHFGSRDELCIDIMKKISKFKKILSNYEKNDFEYQEQSLLAPKLLDLISIFKSKTNKERLMSSGFISRSILQSLKKEDFDFECEHLFVDEFQDTNRTQSKILNSLKERFGFDITFVGDYKQAIYKFRDASSQAFFEFDSKVDQKHKQYLNSSYRSNKSVLASTNWLFERYYENPDYWHLFSDPKSLMFSNEQNYPLTIWSCEKAEINKGIWKKSGSFGRKSKNIEKRTVDCVSWIKEKHPDESILVLARNWNQLGRIAKSLNASGLNAVIAGNPNLINDDDIDQDVVYLKKIIKCLVNPDDQMLLSSVLLGNCFAHTLKDLGSNEGLKESINLIQAYSSRVYHGDSITAVLTDFLNETGYLYGIKGDSRSHERTLKIFEFLKIMLSHEKEGSFDKFSDTLEWIDVYFRTHSPPSGLSSPQPIVLRTVYGAKGLSADHVVIVNPDERWLKSCFEDLEFEKILPSDSYSEGNNSFELILTNDGELESMWLSLGKGDNGKYKIWTNESFIDSWGKNAGEFYDEEVNLNYVSMTRARKTMHAISNGFYHPQKTRKGDLFSVVYRLILENFDNSFEAFSNSSLGEVDIPIPEKYIKEQASQGNSFVKYLFPKSRRAKEKYRALDRSLLDPNSDNFVLSQRSKKAIPLSVSNVDQVIKGDALHKVLDIFGPPVKDSWLKDVQNSSISHVFNLEKNDFYSLISDFSEKLKKNKTWLGFTADFLNIWTEYPLCGSYEKQFQKIDLLIELEEKFIIIDWKTGQKTDKKIDQYSLQVNAYKDVLSNFLKKQNVNKGIECYIAWVDQRDLVFNEVF